MAVVLTPLCTICLTDVNLAGTTALATLKLGGTAISADAGDINSTDGAVAGTIVNSILDGCLQWRTAD